MTHRPNRPAAIWSCILLAGAASLAGCDGRDSEATLAVISAAATATTASTSDSAPPTPAPFKGTLPPGWAMVVRGSGVENTLHAPFAAFAADKGDSLSSVVPPENQTASFTTTLNVAEAGDYRFFVEIAGGSVEFKALRAGVIEPVTIFNASADGLVGGNWITLPQGTLTLTAKFTRRGGGACRMRTMWERKRVGDVTGFKPEPIPVESTSVPKFAIDAVAKAEDAARGRVLLGELNCVACHAPPENVAGLIPARKAPVLEEIGRRASPQWLMKWIADPQSVKPGSGMPTLHPAGAAGHTGHGGHGGSHAVDAEAITHYLVSPYYNASDDNQPVANERPVLGAGRQIYHSVGCIACHGPLESPAAALDNSSQPNELPKAKVAAPFGDLTDKWRPVALSAFLREPLKAHPSGRMPDMKLGPEDADLLANYLVHTWTKRDGSGARIAPAAFVVDPAKVETGKAAFVSHGCNACHGAGPNTPKLDVTLKAPSLKDLAGRVENYAGCLDPADKDTPRYTLSDDDRRSLAAAIKTLPGVKAQASIENGKAIFAAMNCRACHTKEGLGGPDESLWAYFTTLNDVELGNEGRIPPRLTNVGWKLTTQWMRQVLHDGGVARPYMATRMPQFGAANLPGIAEYLARLEGIAPDVQEPEPPAGPELAAAGRAIVGEKGLNCISCHVVGDHPPAGTPGPAITSFGERLRFSWFNSYAHAPTRFKPGTRMPAFWMTGNSAATSILSGEATKQIEALWAYFQQGEFAPLPEGIKVDAGLALKPNTTPLVFRTFLKDAGSRGIAVGYPGNGPHFGFDADQVRLRDAWTGEFVDASSAWRGRGGMKADGQGPQVWTAPDGPAILVAADVTTWPDATGPDAGTHFKGYEFNAKREPTFVQTHRASAGGTDAREVTIREWFGPTQTKGRLFARRITVSNHNAMPIWLNAGKDADVARVDNADVAKVDIAGRAILKVTPKNPGDVTITLVVGTAKAAPAAPPKPAPAPAAAPTPSPAQGAKP